MAAPTMSNQSHSDRSSGSKTRAAPRRVTLKGTFPSAEERARVIRDYGADEGTVQTLSRLGQYVDTESRKDRIMNPKPAFAQVQDKEPIFTASRILDAPRDLVWATWTNPQHLMHWWGPKEFTVAKCEIDPRPGGFFHYALKSPDGKIVWGKWTFREILPPEEMVVVVAFSEEKGGVTRHPWSPSWPLQTLSIMTLENMGGKTKLTIQWSPLNPTEEERQTFAGGMDSMKQGWGGTMDQLADYLAKVQ
jgi:uncharacterized protein YndB with AHSA1/START domain